MRVKSLYSYPVKSMRGRSLHTMVFDAFGPKGDRRYMLVDESGRFISQREVPQLSQCAARIDGNELHLDIAGYIQTLHCDAFVRPMSVQVWSDQAEALACVDELPALNALVGKPVSLVYMPESSFRQVDRTYYSPAQRVSFADGFPVLLTNESSLEDLNDRLDHAVPMERFRPNIVIEGAGAFEEDAWKKIQIGELELSLVKPCSRCVMTTIDANGNKGREPLRTLSSFRRNEFGVCFGQNAVHHGKGAVHVGDSVSILA